MALSADQRAGLWRAKLRSIARDHFGRADGTDHAAPWGAALETNGVWTTLIEVAPGRSFGQALVLAANHQATDLDLVVVEEEAIVARRAALFGPSPTVWRLDGTLPQRVDSSAPAEPLAAAPLEDHIASLLDVVGVDIIVEHGVTTGECRGIEVARVTGSGDEQRLDVGVGAYDQGAFAVMNPDLTPSQALADVVSQVLDYRSRGADPHPLNRLARERWVRAELLDEPALLGLDSIAVVEPPLPRDGIKDSTIAPAIGTATGGERVLVACSVGIDLEAVPGAVELADRHQAERVVMVVPDRDRHPIVQAVADRSRIPVSFATAPEPWSD